jgi:hypothetical protein
MRLSHVLIATTGIASVVLPAAAFAADLALTPAQPPIMARQSFISEVRLGVFAHDPTSPEKGPVDINGEILTVKPFVPADPVLAFFVPRLALGGTLNTAGGTSHGYASLAWTYDITSKLFVEASVGVAFHNGNTGTFVPRDRVALGCSPLFRESGSLGYRFDEHWSIMATVEHLSNADACSRNRGLTNYGVRVGYAF